MGDGGSRGHPIQARTCFVERVNGVCGFGGRGIWRRQHLGGEALQVGIKGYPCALYAGHGMSMAIQIGIARGQAIG